MEVVIDVFTKLGPRFIVVKDEGLLLGLITKKDVAKMTNAADDPKSLLKAPSGFDLSFHVPSAPVMSYSLFSFLTKRQGYQRMSDVELESFIEN